MTDARSTEDDVKIDNTRPEQWLAAEVSPFPTLQPRKGRLVPLKTTLEVSTKNDTGESNIFFQLPGSLLIGRPHSGRLYRGNSSQDRQQFPHVRHPL